MRIFSSKKPAKVLTNEPFGFLFLKGRQQKFEGSDFSRPLA